MKKKPRKAPPKPALQVDSTISLLREILAAIKQSNKLLVENNVISLATNTKVRDIDIELSAQGEALLEIQEVLTSMDGTLEEILSAIRGPEAQSATLSLVAGN